jgi:hypothetical protein
MLTLHKLPEGFIVTSDETPNNFDWVIDNDCKNSWQLQIQPQTDLSKYKKVIAQQDQIDFSGLKEEEQKQIGWFDVDLTKLCYYDKRNPDFQIKEEYGYDEEEVKATGNFAKNNCACDNCFYGRSKLTEQLIKIQELLTSDKRFTLEDIRKAFHAGQLDKGNNWYGGDVNLFIQSLSQPKSWEIEVEVEYRDMMGMWISRPTILEHLDRPSRPKLTNGKIKILKVL